MKLFYLILFEVILPELVRWKENTNRHTRRFTHEYRQWDWNHN